MQFYFYTHRVWTRITIETDQPSKCCWNCSGNSFHIDRHQSFLSTWNIQCHRTILFGLALFLELHQWRHGNYFWGRNDVFLDEKARCAIAFYSGDSHVVGKLEYVDQWYSFQRHSHEHNCTHCSMDHSICSACGSAVAWRNRSTVAFCIGRILNKADFCANPLILWPLCFNHA